METNNIETMNEPLTGGSGDGPKPHASVAIKPTGQLEATRRNNHQTTAARDMNAVVEDPYDDETVMERQEEEKQYVAPDAMTEFTDATRVVKVEERFANEGVEPKDSPGVESSKREFDRNWVAREKEEEAAARRPSLAKEPLEFK